MASVQKEQSDVTSTMSDEAYELISCFYRGVDDLVYQLAVRFAKERNPQCGTPVEVEVEDVRRAGCEVVRRFREALGEDVHIPDEFRESLSGMTECFENSAKSRD